MTESFFRIVMSECVCRECWNCLTELWSSKCCRAILRIFCGDSFDNFFFYRCFSCIRSLKRAASVDFMPLLIIRSGTILNVIYWPNLTYFNALQISKLSIPWVSMLNLMFVNFDYGFFLKLFFFSHLCLRFHSSISRYPSDYILFSNNFFSWKSPEVADSRPSITL